MNGGLLGSHAGNTVLCVPSLNFRVYVTCKTQIDWFVYAGEGNRVVYLLTDVILWLTLGFYTSAPRLPQTHTHCLIPGRHRSWPETTSIWTQFSAIDSPKTTKTTTTKNACWRMQIGRKSIKSKPERQGCEMKEGSEGRRLEFSTSVTLAGLSIMCNVVRRKYCQRAAV